jgi:hypothetical protein
MAVIEVDGLTRRYRSRTGTFRRRTEVVARARHEYEGRRSATLETF